MQSNYKMNIEEIKKYLWCEQIKVVIERSICGNRVIKPEPWYVTLWRGHIKSDPTGWSRTTFNKRWVQLVREGYITEYRHMSGHVRKDDIPELIDKVFDTINALTIGDFWDREVIENMTYEQIYKEYF